MNRLALALRLTSVGFFIGGCILLGVFLGLWLDKRLGTSPLLVIVGLLLGVALAIYLVYRMLVPLLYNRQDKGNNK